MATAVDWFRKECNALESRANGRVTPALLDPVRVNLPGADGGANWVRLEEVATVGVKDGSTLIITVFDDAVCLRLTLALRFYCLLLIRS